MILTAALLPPLFGPILGPLLGDTQLDAEATFAAPEALTTAGPAFSTLIYPTPVLEDVDGDGARELVIGDLIGNLFVCQPGEDGTWGKMEPMRAEGEALVLDNW